MPIINTRQQVECIAKKSNSSAAVEEVSGSSWLGQGKACQGLLQSATSLRKLLGSEEVFFIRVLMTLIS